MNKIIPGDIEGTVKNLTEGKRNAVVMQIEDHNGAWEGNHRLRMQMLNLTMWIGN